MSTAVCELRSSARSSERPSLERVGTLTQRSEAIKTALSRGVPLHEIEADLDWLDAVRVESPVSNERGYHRWIA